MSDLVTEPCVLLDLPDDQYHGDERSLSSSGARALLQSPARFRYDQLHSQGRKKAFDLGHGVHTKVLGIGMGVAVPTDPDGVPYPRWDSKAAKQAVADIREAGMVPLKEDEARRVDGMAESLLAHPIAGRLLAAEGVAEQSLFWTDPETGTWLRARPDWTTDVAMCDLKTTADASRAGFRKSVANFGYHQQQPWYVGGHAALGMGDIAFLFLCVETDPPYLANVHVLDDEAVEMGAARNRGAIDLYARCVETGEWPGYPVDLTPLRLPSWVSA